MKKTQFKAGQLVTLCGKVYRIKKTPDYFRRVCPFCDMKDNDFYTGCFKYCYRRLGSRMPMRYYYEQVGKSTEW